MKAPVLGLIVAVAAFGGSSIYLWTQLNEERARADEFAAKSAALNARIAELEKARGEFQEHRFASAGNFGAGREMLGAGPPPPDAEKSGPSEDPRWARPSPERSAAMQKMMRTQLRANNRRLYADVGSALGLGKEDANRLIDLLTDQQVEQFGQRRNRNGHEDGRSSWEETLAKQKADLTDLLGADKAQSLEEYQKTLPARQELEMVSHQLESYDAPLTADQSKKLLSAMIEERERVPPPEYVDGTDMAQFRQSRQAWEDDYNERVSSQVHSILSTDQASAYTEMQQAQKEMRAQFATMGPGGPRRTMPGTQGNAAYVEAAPVGGVVMFSEAPPPPPGKK